MKTLLSILGSVALTTVPVTGMVNVMSQNHSRFDPINNFVVPEEMKLELQKLIDLKIDPEGFKDDENIIKIIYQGTLMSEEVIDEDFYYNILDRVREVINLKEIKDRLDKYEFNGQKFIDIISKKLDDISRENYIKNNNIISNDFIDYQNLNNIISRKFFDIYDSKITGQTLSLVKKQKELNDLNERNKQIQITLDSLSEQNEIIGKILKVLDTTTKFINKVKDIFDRAYNKADSNYKSAQWHASNWGLGVIPFYGIGFNVDFKNKMKDSTDGMKIFIDSFQNQTGEGADAFGDMMKNLDDVQDKLSETSTNKNIVDDLLNMANINSATTDLINTAITGGLDLLNTAIPGLGDAVKAVLKWLGDLFNAHELANDFNNQLKPNYEKFQPIALKFKTPIYDGLNSVIQSQYSLLLKEANNNIESKKLSDELKSNKKRVEELNKEINELQEKIKHINNTVEGDISIALSSNSLFYWYSNTISDISINTSRSRVSTKDNIQDLLNMRKELWNKISKNIHTIENVDPNAVSNIIKNESKKIQDSNVAMHDIIELY